MPPTIPARIPMKALPPILAKATWLISDAIMPGAMVLTVPGFSRVVIIR